MRVTLLTTSLVALAAAGCGATKGPDDEARAAALVQRLMEARRTGDMAAAIRLYSPVFFERTPQPDWEATLRSIPQRLGALERWTITDTSTDPPGAADALVTVTLTVVCERGEATETVTLYRPQGEADLRIVGHEIALPALP